MSDDQSKKVKTKKAKKSGEPPIVKRLNSNSMYPMKEKAWIYTIAALSALGLFLIVYSGIMSFAHSGVLDGSSTDLDVDDINEIIDELDLDEPTEPEEETVPEEPETEAPTEPEEDEGISGVITENNVVFRREPAGTDIIGELHTNTEVTILDMESNPYWTHISVDGQEGFVESNRLEPVSE